MGLFKKIFGKADPVRDMAVNDEIEKIKSGDINLVYPILKPGDWIGLKFGSIYKTLIEENGETKLVVGYGYDAPQNFIFLNEGNLENKSPEEWMNEAAINLDNYEVNINEVVPGKVAIIDGKDFCSEKILSKKFMFEMHTLLDSNDLLVSIPRRRCMMITSAPDNPQIMAQFESVHKSTWADDSYGNPPIINLYFEVNKGEIVGHKEV